MKRLRTQVGIVGCGPAGLMLAHLLQLAGIDAAIVELRSRAYVEGRIRAGVLEQTTVDLLREVGMAGRLDREGLLHHGIELGFRDVRHRIDMTELTGGRSVVVYGQHEVVKDFIARRLEDGLPIFFDSADVSVHGVDDGTPTVRFLHEGEELELLCDFIAGADGFHGICRPLIPSSAVTLYDRQYPFAWLGILAEAAPSREELIYQNHPRGFALYSMRSPTVTRLYLQCAPDEDLLAWSDDRIWDELTTRLRGPDGWEPRRGTILQKSVTGMRSFVTDPMQYGTLFLLGDAAHIVPPTGAKGMNLAIADAFFLSRALALKYSRNSNAELHAYTSTCLDRIWKVQRFSWWMTSLLHRWNGRNPFDDQTQLAELDYVCSSRAASTTLAENYTGLPLRA